jgi:hypothetical protein
MEPFKETAMKRLDFYYFLTLGLILLVLFGVPHFRHHTKRSTAAPTKEQLSSHMITLLDKSGEEEGLCTATAIGPHAILTAEHCDKGGKYPSLLLDRSTEPHNVMASVCDGRDHVILLLDGAPFERYETIISATDSIYKIVVLYGDGHGEYPPVAKYGTIVSCEDPSDIDAYAGQICFTLPVIPGDSGSAIYNTKGEVVGVVTYQYTDEDSNIKAIGFALDFPQLILDTAYTFDGTEEGLPKP